MATILYKARPRNCDQRGAHGGTATVEVTPQSVGWQYLSFSAHTFFPGESMSGNTGDFETGLVILGGVCTITAGESRFEKIGQRVDVWDKTPPFAVLLPPNIDYDITAHEPLQLAVAGCVANDCEPTRVRLITPDDIIREERGEGQTYRTIHHILPPRAESARLQLVEVFTPAGNWSSFPPHKHDTENPPHEAYLEETYYYRINPKDGFALQRVYSGDGSFDEVCAPSDGDLVVVPRGYHPVAAMPGHDCYYLNVMAGPGKEWNFTVDPRYEWLMNWSKPLT